MYEKETNIIEYKSKNLNSSRNKYKNFSEHKLNKPQDFIGKNKDIQINSNNKKSINFSNFPSI